MSELIRVPDIGNGQGEVIELLVKVGDTVEADQSLLTLESDKASMEIPSPKAGVVKSLKVKVGDTLKEGDEILELEVEGGSAAAEAPKAGDPGDPNSCDYWRYCSIDGFLCSCCGGTTTSCPPGTDASQVTWIGTCRNPADGKDYIISYNDCCGKHSCSQCACTRNESEEPLYRPFNNNDVNWCLGAESRIYNCTVTIIRGVAV